MNCLRIIKKVTSFSFMILLGIFTYSNAQDIPYQKSSSDTETNSTAKVFGGRAQYRTWSVGLHAGILAPVTFISDGRFTHYSNWDINLGYGLSIRKQLAHSFGVELNGVRGTLSGSNKDKQPGGVQNDLKSFNTTLNWSVSLLGVVNVATIDFLRRENNLNFLVKAGYGISDYNNTMVKEDNTTVDNKHTNEKHFPVGVGAKFRLSDRVNIDVGNTMYFLASNRLDGGSASLAGTPPPPSGMYSYTYAGLELALGSTDKPNLDWANPVAMMYDELKDKSLNKELAALKQYIASQNVKLEELLKDTDGDCVSDKFDKCPNTEAGVKVDACGCPLDTDGDGVPDSNDKCPTEPGDGSLDGCLPQALNNENSELGPKSGKSKDNIQFEVNSYVLKTSSYGALNDLAATFMQVNPYSKIRLEGHASLEGTEEYNMQLSIDRANSVKTYLVNAGIQSSKITVKGFGERRPIASNDTEEGRSLNRRVEIIKVK